MLDGPRGHGNCAAGPSEHSYGTTTPGPLRHVVCRGWCHTNIQNAARSKTAFYAPTRVNIRSLRIATTRAAMESRAWVGRGGVRDVRGRSIAYRAMSLDLSQGREPIAGLDFREQCRSAPAAFWISVIRSRTETFGSRPDAADLASQGRFGGISEIQYRKNRDIRLSTRCRSRFSGLILCSLLGADFWALLW